MFLRVAIAVRDIGIDRAVIVRGELPAGLVVEALADHVDQHDILPVADMQAGGARLVEHLAAGKPAADSHSRTVRRSMPGLVMAEPNSPVWLKRPHSDAPIAMPASSPLAS